MKVSSRGEPWQGPYWHLYASSMDFKLGRRNCVASANSGLARGPVNRFEDFERDISQVTRRKIDSHRYSNECLKPRSTGQSEDHDRRRFGFHVGWTICSKTAVVMVSPDAQSMVQQRCLMETCIVSAIVIRGLSKSRATKVQSTWEEKENLGPIFPK